MDGDELCWVPKIVQREFRDSKLLTVLKNNTGPADCGTAISMFCFNWPSSCLDPLTPWEEAYLNKVSGENETEEHKEIKAIAYRWLIKTFSDWNIDVLLECDPTRETSGFSIPKNTGVYVRADIFCGVVPLIVECGNTTIQKIFDLFFLLGIPYVVWFPFCGYSGGYKSGGYGYIFRNNRAEMVSTVLRDNGVSV
jgi:hypothetical protein